jgi:hypothetical protein
MKKLIFVFFLHFFILNTFAQFSQFPRPGEGNLSGGLGLNWIDGDLYYTFHFTPEVSFANFGVGLDLHLDFDKDGNLRKENFNEFSDYLSLIRYARYGLKNDPLYVKLGALDYHTLGHGSIMYQYNNSPSFDARKAGLVLDIDFGKFGFESIYSSFGEAGVVGLRGYVRPLQYTSAGMIPVIGNLEVGATYAADFHENAGIISGLYNTSSRSFVSKTDVGSINIIGFDIGLPIVSSSLLNLELYADYSKIIDFGSGVATGIIAQFGGLGLITAVAKLERRFNNDQYIPSYFNSFYEIERFRIDSIGLGLAGARTKSQQLAATVDVGNGYFGALGVSVLGMFDILGSYQRLDKDPESGILHLSTQIAPEDFSMVARAGYDKINIKDEKDLFTLDERSYLFFELGYKPIPYILVSMVYHWTFTPVRDAGDNIIDYEPQKRIEPRISFIFPFSVGN